MSRLGTAYVDDLLVLVDGPVDASSGPIDLPKVTSTNQQQKELSRSDRAG